MPLGLCAEHEHLSQGLNKRHKFASNSNGGRVENVTSTSRVRRHRKALRRRERRAVSAQDVARRRHAKKGKTLPVVVAAVGRSHCAAVCVGDSVLLGAPAVCGRVVLVRKRKWLIVKRPRVLRRSDRRLGPYVALQL